MKCRVRVRTGGKTHVHHQDARPGRPSMAFALPAAESRAETAPEPSSTATENSTRTNLEATTEASSEPRKADPRLVADRVYDIMKQEIIIARIRGGK